jgi:septum site-determining protein MinC
LKKFHQNFDIGEMDMSAKQIVTLKGQRDGIGIILDESADFGEIQESLRKKVSQGKQFFDGAGVKVSFKGRVLNDLDEKILIDIITEETNLDITFVQGEGFVPPPANDAPPSVAAAPMKSGQKESPTIYQQGGLRSGQTIKYKGSVVVVGDVNPGSEIVADGNVVILGALKGMAHAGATGDESCFVSALSLQPTQLRIANLISYVPKNEKNTRSAAYAYIKDGQVYITAC